MNKKSLWKRIFGQHDKKARVQAAFQEQFETKLQFRELEPRVVLAADAAFDGLNNLSITITGSDNEQIEFSRNGVGNLILTGVDSFNGGAGGTVAIGLNQFNSVSILNSGTGETSVTFVGGPDNLDGTFANSLFIRNIDSVVVESGADFEITGFFQLESFGPYENASQLDLQGKLSAQSFHVHVQNNTGASLTVQSTASGQLEAEFFHAYEEIGASGDLVVDLGSGSHDIDVIEANGREIELSISDINDITLATIRASKLSVTAGTQGIGSISQQVGTAVTVNDSTTTFIANGDINLVNASNDFAGTVSASGKGIALRDSNNIFLGEIVASTLDVTAGGTIKQTEGGEKITVSGATQLELTNAGDIDLQYGANDFAGVSAAGVNFLNSFHLRNDNASGGALTGLDARLASGAMQDFSLLLQNGGSLSLSTIDLQGNLVIRGGAALGQNAAWKVDGTTGITVGAGSNVSLTNVNNEFGGAVSINGGAARAGVVQIFDNSGDLVLGDIHATSLVADSQGAILQAAAGLDILQTTALVAGDGASITLDSSNNVLAGSISAEGQTGAAGAVAIHNTVATALASVHGATLTVHSGGAIQQQSGTIQASTASLNVSSGAAITLDKLNQIGTILAEGAAGSAAGDLIITNDGSLALDTIHASKLTVIVQNGGDLTNTLDGDITVSGLTTLNAANITLGENSGNSHDFSTITLAATGNVTITDSLGELTFVGDTNVGGSLVAKAINGSILQAGGKLEITGTSHFTAKNGESVTLNASNNTFGGSLSVTGDGGTAGAVYLKSGGTLLLDVIDATTLTARASGVTQTATGLGVTTSTTITVDNGGTVDLDEVANTFGTLTITGEGGAAGVVTLKSSGNLHLDAIAATTFIAQATSVSQTSAGLNVSTSSAFTVDNGKTVDLDTASNTFGTLSVTGDGGQAGTVALRASGNLHLDDIDADVLTARSASVSQTSTSLNISTSSKFTVDAAGDVDLAEAANKFGMLSVIGDGGQAGTVALRASGNLHLDDIDADVLIARSASVSQTSTSLNISTSSKFTVDAAGDVDLAAAANKFGMLSVIGDGGLAGTVDLKASGNLHLDDIDATTLNVRASNVTQTAMGLSASTSTTITVDNGGTVDLDAAANTFGILSITGDGGAAGTVTLQTSSNLMLGTIKTEVLTATAINSNITDQMGQSITVSGLATLSGQSIALDESGHAFNQVTLKTTGDTTNGHATVIDSFGDLTFVGNSSIGGNLIATANDGSILQTSGNLNIAGTSHFTAKSGATIELNKSGNVFGDSLSAIAGATGTVTINTDSDLILGTIETGNLTATANASHISDTSGKTISVSDLTTLFSKSVALDEPGHHFNEITLTTTGDIVTGHATIFDSSDNLTFVGISSVGGNLIAKADDGSILQTSGNLNIAGTSHITAKSGATIELNQSDNVFGDSLSAIAGATGTVTIKTDSDLILGTIETGNLTATAINSAILDSSGQTINVAGLATLTGKSLILDELGHNLHEVTVTTTASSEIVEADGFYFVGNSTVGDDLKVTSGGAIQDTVTSQISVTDEAWFNGTTVTLNQSSGKHAFANLRLTTTGSADIVEIDGVTFFDKTDVNGNLRINSGGDILQSSGEIKVVGESDLFAGGKILFTSVLNDFTGPVNTTGSMVELTDANSIILGSINAQELAVLAVAGSITQTPADVNNPLSSDKILVAGDANLTAVTGNITLENQLNDFDSDGDGKGAVRASAMHVKVHDANSIILGEIAAGTLAVTAGGSIVQLAGEDALPAEKITVSGTTHLTILGAGSDIDLQYGANKFTDIVTVTGGANLNDFHFRNDDPNAAVPSGDLVAALAAGGMVNVTLLFPGSNALSLPEINIDGSLIVNIKGDLTQHGAIDVNKDASFKAETIILAQAASLDVEGAAYFKTTSGDIQVGVVSHAVDEFARGMDSGQTVNFGTLSFDANGYHVTIAEDSQIDLIGENTAKSLVLVSRTAGISDTGGTSLTVDDLATFKAVAGDIDLQQKVDLRILYTSAAGNVAIVESSSDDGVNIVDGSTAGGTLAIDSNGHILQVNDFRLGTPPGNTQIVANNAIFHAEGSVLLTDLKVKHLAGTASGSTITVVPVDPNDADNHTRMVVLANYLANTTDGFSGTLKIDTFDFVPVATGDLFAPQGPHPASVISGDYSFIAVNNGSLMIDEVAGVDGVAGQVGIHTKGGAGHVFLRTQGAGANLVFSGSVANEKAINLANAGILTALAEGKLSIAANTELVSQVGSTDAVVREIYVFQETENGGNNPELGGNLGIIDGPTFGPTYVREIGDTNSFNLDPNTTLFIDLNAGVDSKVNVTLTQLGVNGEEDLQVVIEWGDGTTESFLFSEATANAKLSHFFASDFIKGVPDVTVTVAAYNSPLINLYDSVDSGTGDARNLNVVQDQILMIVDNAPKYVPEVTEFVPPSNPIPQMAPVVTYTVSQVTTQVEFTDDTRVATPIDGVSVVEVSRNDPDMAIGDEIQLGDEFMTLDAVKEQIQQDERFRPGLYRITILYPGVETPQVFLFEKQIRATPLDIFGSSPPQQTPVPQINQVVEATQNAATAEEVWAREYEKWFPNVMIEQVEEDNVQREPAGPVPADERQGLLPTDDEIFLERISLLDPQEVDRLTERLRAQRSVVRDSLNGVLVGGAALMAAAAVQRRSDHSHFATEEESPSLEVRGGARERLRRRLKQWL